MKYLIPLSLSSLILASTLACTPANTPAGNNANPPTLENKAKAPTEMSLEEKINEGVESYSFAFFSQDKDGALSPVNPENLEFIKVGDQNIQTNDFLMLGSKDSEKVTQSKNAQLEWVKGALEGKELSAFKGGGNYSFFTSQTDKTLAIQIKLKGESQVYHLTRVENATQGSFILNQGNVLGSFDTQGDFKVAQISPGILSQLGGDILGSGFIGKIILAAVGGDVDMKKEEDDKENKEKLNQAFQANKNFLENFSHFSGNWKPENSILLALVPGKTLSFGLNRSGDKDIKASVTIESGTFSRNTPMDQLKPQLTNTDNKEYTLDLADGDKAISVKLKVINANRISVTLLSSTATELEILRGTEIFLQRI